MFEVDSPFTKYFALLRMFVEALPEDILSWFGIILAGILAAVLAAWVLGLL